MDKININKLLNRDNEILLIKNMLNNFENKKNDLTILRGIYLYGETGCGKTHFINTILSEINYDLITYDSSDFINKQIITNITKNNLGDCNILDLFEKKQRKLAIIMDEIDGMNSGDKGGINGLIKLVRPKKTKKQLNEEISNVPIIIIGSNHINKKISELMKTTLNIKLNSPTSEQIKNILMLLFINESNDKIDLLVNFIKNDFRKLHLIYNIYLNNKDKFFNILNILSNKLINKEPKDLIYDMFHNNYKLHNHNLLNETDRTTIGLLWHENIVDYINKLKNKSNTQDIINFYYKILENYTFSDYIDRITFQKQIWQFNEMSSLIKTMYNNKLYHDFKINVNKKNNKENKDNKENNEIRFTKILTKYSTEYNNKIFLIDLCQKLNVDIKDLLCLNEYLLNNNEYEDIIKNNDEIITKLDILRLEKFKNR